MQKMMENESLRGACLAAAAAVTFTIFSIVLGYFWAIVVAVIAAAGLPYARRLREKRLRQRFRQAALEAIDELFDEINRSRYGTGVYRFDEESEERFSVARNRILTLYNELKTRAEYLDDSQAGETVVGADWCQIVEIAAALKRAVSDSAYWCHHKIWRVNPGPLADDWVNPYLIHQLSAEARLEARQRRVVPMSEYENLRKAHSDPGGGASVVSLAARKPEE